MPLTSDLRPPHLEGSDDDWMDQFPSESELTPDTVPEPAADPFADFAEEEPSTDDPNTAHPR